MASLIARVHVTDGEGTAHVYGPGDDVPSWAVLLITNPKAWDEPPAQADLRESEPVKPPVKRAAPRRKAATSDDAVHSG
jgi:hypothetical protein